MDRLDAAVLTQLIATEAPLAATIYIPMHTGASPPHISENQIRFKNLLHKAAAKVKDADSHSKLSDELEQKVDQAHGDLVFWEEQTPGLLVCAVSGNIQMFHLPIDTEEYVAIDRHFHLAPVIGLMHDEHEFYLLALAQHHPKLYKGSLLQGLWPARVALPESPKKALNIDEASHKAENQGSAVGPSTSPRGFNGRGGGHNPQEADRLRFFRIIDKTINEAADWSLPLILAGIEAEIAEYRSVSKYPHLLKGTVPGNHSADNLKSLFGVASVIVRQELVVPEHKAVLEEYQMVSGANPSRVASDFGHISEAATQGRVAKLLARMSQRTADTVRDNVKKVPRLTFPENTNDGKRLNDVVISVWRTSGTVLNLLPDEMPNGAFMAARLRY